MRQTRFLPARLRRPTPVLIAALLAHLACGGWLAAKSLDQRALIRRDSYGVPHILAETEQAAAFAHGYAAAEDHLEQMARLFLRARGEQASVFGAAKVDEDLLIHKLGIWETARDRFHELPPLMQAILDGYAGGYNAYLAKAGAPEWARPVSGVDVLAHCRAVLLVDFSLDMRPWKRPGLTPGFGSNMWALGRARSQSGRGMLLANPHLRWDGSHLFHEVQLTVPGRINISGATLIGFPVVTIGFNEFLGWSHTVNQHHNEAVYELELDADHPGRYRYEGEFLPLEKRSFQIRVKSGDKVETRTETALWSHHGPIVKVDGNRAYAYQSTSLDSVNFLAEYNAMAKAKSWVEFRAALNMQELPMFNVGYADRRGDVYFLYNGREPVRPGGYDWTKAVPGGDSRTEWRGIRALAELPQIFNPPQGYVQNCNDAPWYAARPAILDPANYPDYDGDAALGLRGQMSLKMLESSRSFGIEDIKRLKYNEQMLLADRLKPELIDLAASQGGGELKAALEALRKWDNNASRDSRGAVLFQQWWDIYARKTTNRFRVPWSRERAFDTPAGIGSAGDAVAALAEAAAWVAGKYGDLGVPWGAIHRLRRGDVDLPLGGVSGMGAFRSILYRQDRDEKWAATAGDSYVLAVEFTDPPTAYSVLAYSESSQPKSKHFSDQSALFAGHEYKRAWFSEEDIQGHIERAYHPGE